uniref:Jerky protein homolog-like n=1 Tax=Diabrotica virgifera virgifera TaxID=50390 RepID=A0A6P7HDQ1_DIAVI
MPPNVTAMIQPMDQGVISSLKRNYRSAILQKRIEEGNDLKSFWKDFTILDAIYEVRSVWEKTKPLTIVRSWKKIMPDICEDDDFLGFDETDFVVKNITEAIKDVPGGEEVDGENILQWLDCDAEDQGYEQLTDEQIVNKITGWS